MSHPADSLTMQMNIRNNTREMQDCIKDLYSWEAEISRKEDEIKRSRGSGSTSSPAIRGKAAPLKSTAVDPELQKPSRSILAEQSNSGPPPPPRRPLASKNAAEHTYDYFRDKWDKFDVEAALAEVDEEEEPSLRGSQRKSTEPLASRIEGSRNQEPKPTEGDHDYWKERGNSFFKLGDFHKAKDCFTESLTCKETHAAYTNRALTCLKLEEWQQAQDDCTKVLKVDQLNLKAWQRRAAAKKGAGDVSGYLKDLDHALKLAPDSTSLSKELKSSLSAYLKETNLSMPSSSTAFTVEANLHNACHQPQDTAGEEASSQDTMGQDRTHSSGDRTRQLDSDTSKFRDETAQELEQNKKGKVHDRIEPQALDSAQVNVLSKSTDATSSQTRSTHVVKVPQISASVPDMAPGNSGEFECHWRTIKGNQESRMAYICLIDPASLRSLFGSALTPDYLEGIIRTALLYLQEASCGKTATRMIDILKNMPKVQRFGMNLMLVSKKVKKELADLWKSVNTTYSDELEDVRKCYKM